MPIPSKNHGVYLQHKAHIDTTFNFSQFFGADHTIMAWFMPQYVYAGDATLLGENGSGVYRIGPGEYRHGNGGLKKEGDPVFKIKIGNQTAMYLLPAFKRGQWHHVAVSRTQDTFKLFLNGQLQVPVAKSDTVFVPTGNLTVTAATPSLPSGTLRFGTHTSVSNAIQQPYAYGILDDVAVFNKALTANEVVTIMNNKRIQGNEPALLIGWGFDNPEQGGQPLPGKLQSFWQSSSGNGQSALAKLVSLSLDRNSATDSELFDNSSLLALNKADIRLPVPYGKVFRVVQGYDSPSGSHNGGTAAFCYDLSMQGEGPYPDGPEFCPVYVGAIGKVVEYMKGLEASSDGMEENYVRIQTEQDEFVKYQHFDGNSIPADFDVGQPYFEGGKLVSYVVPESAEPTVAKHDLLGKAGKKAKHVHVAAGSGRAHGYPSGVNFPLAIADYEYSIDGVNWTHVARGHPKAKSGKDEPDILVRSLLTVGVYRDTWTAGWTHFMPFELNGQPHYLAYKSTDGALSSARIAADGKGATELMRTTATAGWTHFMPFRLNGQPHYLSYKSGDSTLAIARIWGDGKGMEELMRITATAGWTHFMPFELNGQPHYLSYKSGDSTLAIARIWGDGKGTEELMRITATAGWTHFMPFELNGQPYYLAYKKTDGTLSSARIAANGKGTTELMRTTATAGWTHFMPFKLNGQPHYLSYKSGDFTLAIARVWGDGKGMEDLMRIKATAGWTHFMPFELSGKPHYLAYKTSSGEVAIARLID